MTLVAVLKNEVWGLLAGIPEQRRGGFLQESHEDPQTGHLLFCHVMPKHRKFPLNKATRRRLEHAALIDEGAAGAKLLNR